MLVAGGTMHIIEIRRQGALRKHFLRYQKLQESLV